MNVGNMHADGKKTVYHESHVYVDDQDLADFDAIKSAGVDLFIQILPTDRKTEI